MSTGQLVGAGGIYIAALLGQQVYFVTGNPPSALSATARVHYVTAEEREASPHTGLLAKVRVPKTNLPPEFTPSKDGRVLLSPPDPEKDLDIQGSVILEVTPTSGAFELEIAS